MNKKTFEMNYREGANKVWDTIALKFSDDVGCAVFSEDFFWEEIYPIRKNDIKDALVLDAGCGGGRSTYHSSKYAKVTVGIDLGKAALLVAKNRGSSCLFVNGDLSDFPIKEKTFDVIYSFGVLQHTLSPKESYKNLIKALKPGGRILVWVYSEEGNALMLNFIEPLKRFFLNHLPKRLVWLLSYPVTMIKWFFIHALYLPIDKYPMFSFLKKALPKYHLMIFWGKSRTFKWMFASVYDFLSAPIANYHSYDEVLNWTKDTNLMDVEIISRNKSVWKIFGKYRDDN